MLGLFFFLLNVKKLTSGDRHTVPQVLLCAMATNMSPGHAPAGSSGTTGAGGRGLHLSMQSSSPRPSHARPETQPLP